MNPTHSGDVTRKPNTRLAFGWWAGQRWRETGNQLRALAVEVRRHDIPAFVGSSLGGAVQHGGFGERRKEISWRCEVVTVKSKSQDRYRDLKTGRFVKKPSG